MPYEDLTVVVLAAGAGTRMRSRLPKVMHPVAGRPMVWHALRAAAGLSPARLVAVLGHGREQVEQFLAGSTDLPPVTVAVQHEQRGTGHAASVALEALSSPPTGTVVVTYGDVPLLRTATLTALVASHERDGNAVTVLSAEVADPTGYGRVVRDDDGGVLRIVEHRDAGENERAVREINSGVYAFDAAALLAALPRLAPQNDQGELYLTDVVGLARADGHRVGAVVADDAGELEGVNDRVQLAALAAVLRDRIVREHQLAGVTVLDPAATWIDADVTIGEDTVLEPGVQLRAGTSIGGGCVIGPDVTLSACTVGRDARVVRAHCVDSTIGDSAQVGPYAYLRGHAVLRTGSKVGTFVELKATDLGAGAKVPHQTYLGDATVGEATNVGAGVITANYDGRDKFPTRIGAHAFVGSNVTLVAPVEIADGSYVATGSTITEDVPAGALGIARGRQHLSRDWVLRRHPGSHLEAAARAAGAGSAADPQPTSDDPATAPAARPEGEPQQ